MCPHTALNESLSNEIVVQILLFDIPPVDLAAIALSHTKEERATKEAHQVILLGYNLP